MVLGVIALVGALLGFLFVALPDQLERRRAHKERMKKLELTILEARKEGTR
jgi:glucose uptake protein GlcU